MERVDVELGLRDDESERVEVKLGLAQGDTLLLANQAGMLLRAAPGKPVVPLRLPPLAPLSDVLPQPDGAIVAVGMSGAVRLPAQPGAIHDSVITK